MHSSTSPTHTLQRIHRSEPERIVQAIIDDGCCIIKAFSTPEAVNRVTADVTPFLEDQDKLWKTRTCNNTRKKYQPGDLGPSQIKRCSRLVARSKTVRNEWLVDPLIDKLTRIFIDKTTSNYDNLTKHTYTSRAIIGTSVCLEMGPGAQAQRLHRDDKIHHAEHLDQTKSGYRVGSDMSMAFLVPGIETTVENGATQVRS